VLETEIVNLAVELTISLSRLSTVNAPAAVSS
jgi:hypothetical protein